MSNMPIDKLNPGDTVRELVAEFQRWQGVYANYDADLKDQGKHIAYGHCADLLKRALAGQDAVRDALKLYEAAFDQMFTQALSNGLYDVWRRPINCTLLNNAHSAATKVLAGEKP